LDRPQKERIRLYRLSENEVVSLTHIVAELYETASRSITPAANRADKFRFLADMFSDMVDKSYPQMSKPPVICSGIEIGVPEGMPPDKVAEFVTQKIINAFEKSNKKQR